MTGLLHKYILVSGVECTGKSTVFQHFHDQILVESFSSRMALAAKHAGAPHGQISLRERQLRQLQALSLFLHEIAGARPFVLLGRLSLLTEDGLTSGLVDLENLLPLLGLDCMFIFVRDPTLIRAQRITKAKKDGRNQKAVPELDMISFEQNAEVTTSVQIARKLNIPLIRIDMKYNPGDAEYDEFETKIVAQVRERLNLDYEKKPTP